MQVVDVSKDTVAIRSIDWDRDRFDNEFGYVVLSLLSFRLLARSWPVQICFALAVMSGC